MAITQDQLVIKIGADTKDLIDSLDKLKNKTVGLEGATGDLQGSMKNLSKTEIEYALAIERASKSSLKNIDSIDALENSSKNLNDSISKTSASLSGMQLSTDQIKSFEEKFNKAESAVSKLNTTMTQSRNSVGQFTEGFKGAADNTEKAGKSFSGVMSIIGDSLIAASATIATVAAIKIFKGWSDSGIGFTNILKGIGPAISSAFSGIKENIGTALTSFKSLNLSISDIYKLLSLGGLALGSLADMMSTSTVGSLAMASALGTGSASFLAISIAIKLALHSLGSFVEGIGDSLISAMSTFEEKFAKSQQIVVQFGFVIKNFGAAYGSKFIGDLSDWETKIESLAKTSTFSANDIRKATKIVVAENQALGLSYEDNVKFLERAVDIASSSGLELIDVVQRLQSALMGNSTAVAALGINLNTHAIEHSKLNAVMQKTVGTMTSQEKQQIALAEIYRQTDPLVGAAIKQGETIIGINQQIANSYLSIQSKLGSVGVLTLALKSTYADLMKAAEGLPDTFYGIVSSLIDLFGVTFKIIGITLQWMILIGGLHTAYKLLNVVIITNMAIQNTLNGVFSKLGLNIGIQTASIINLSTLFQVFNSILKGGFIFIMANVGHVLQIVAGKVLALSAAILTNPFFLAGVGITIGVVALIKALDELNKEFDIVKTTTADFSETFASMKSVFSTLGGIFAGTFNVLVQSIKIGILSLTELVHYAIIAGSSVGKIFNPSGSEKYNKIIDYSMEKLDTLTAAHDRSMDKIAMGFMGANEQIALHAKYLDDAGKSTDDLAFKQLQLKKIFDEIDVNAIKMSILGTEVEKIQSKYEVATKQVAKFKDEILKSTEIDKEAVNSYKKALEDQITAQFELDKVRIDSLKGLKDVIRDVQRDSLKNNADETKGILAGFDERRDKVTEYKKSLAQLGPISAEVSAQIMSAFSAIDKAQEQAGVDKLTLKIESLKKSLAEAGLEGASQVIAKAKASKEEIDNITKRIIGVDKLTAAHKALADQAKALIDQGAQAEIDKIHKDALTTILQKNTEIKNTTDAMNATRRQAIELELDTQLKLLKIEKDKLDIADTASMLAIGTQEELLKAQAKKKLDDGTSQTYENLEKVGKDTAKSISGVFTNGALSMIGGAVSMVGLVVQAIDALLDFIPNFINSIAGIFNKLTDFPKVLFNAFENLFKGVIRFVEEFVVNLVESIYKSFQQLDDFVNNLSDAFDRLIEKLPDIISNLMEKMPGMLEKLIENVLKSYMKLIASIYTKLIPAIVKGFAEGIKKLVAAFKSLFSGKGWPQVKIDDKGLGKKLADTMKSLSGQTSKLFSVTDLTDAVKDPIKTINEDIKENFQKGADILKQIWTWVWEKVLQPIWDLVTKAWRWVYDNVISPIVSIVQKAFQWVYDNVIGPIVSIVQKAFQWVYDNVIGPIVSLVQTAFQWVVTNILEPLAGLVSDAFQCVRDLWDALANIVKVAFQFVQDLWNNLVIAVQTAFQFVQTIWDGLTLAVQTAFKYVSDLWSGLTSSVSTAFSFLGDIGKKIAQPITEAFSGVTAFFSKIGEAFKSLFTLNFGDFAKKMGEAISGVLNPIMGGFKKIANGIIDFLNNLKLPAVDVGFSVLGKNIGFGWGEIDLLPGNIARLAKGGVVPEGFGTDTVPAMLTPGEFIMSRPAVAQIGLNNLRTMNAGGGVGGNNTYNIDFEINIDAKTTMDEGFIRGTLIPRMQDEMKRASLEGRFVLSQKGIR